MRAIIGWVCAMKRLRSAPPSGSAMGSLALQRIDVTAIDLELVVQVRAGGQARHAHVTDDLACFTLVPARIPLAKRLMCP